MRATAISSARASPTIQGTFSVPARLPRSWPPAVDKAFYPRAVFDIQRSDAFRGVNLVPRKREHINAKLFDIDGRLPTA